MYQIYASCELWYADTSGQQLFSTRFVAWGLRLATSQIPPHLRAHHGSTFSNAAEGLTQITAATHERHLEVVFVDVVDLVGGSEHLPSVLTKQVHHLSAGIACRTHVSSIMFMRFTEVTWTFETGDTFARQKQNHKNKFNTNNITQLSTS